MTNKNEYQREYYQKNIEKMRAQGRARYQAQKEQRRQYAHDYYAKHPEKRKKAQKKYNNSEKGQRVVRDAHLRRKYGLPFGEFDRMLAEQGGVCAICGGPPVARKCAQPARLHVDHDHVTGKVRSLLCMMCNQMLGSCRDTAAILKAGIEYLERHK